MEAQTLLMSAYGLGRLVLKPDSWRLFRYVRGDYQRAYINTSKQAFAVDMTADGFTMGSMYKETAEDGR
jgi:hypothetical protein